MAEASARTARISMKDVRASVRRVQSEGERIVGRLRRDAQSLISRTRRDSVSDLLADALKFEQTIRGSWQLSRSRRGGWWRRS